MMLQDGNVRLRPVVLPDDIRLAVPWYRDPEVLYYSEGGASPYGADQVEKMYRHLLAKGEVFIIEIRQADQWLAIGDAALCTDCLPIVIGDGKYRSQGIGKKVLGLLIRYAQSQGRDKLRVNGVYAYNERSRRLYESFSFVATETYADGDGNESIRYELALRNRTP